MVVDACHKEDASIGLVFPMRKVILVVAMFYLGLLPLLPLKESFFEIPMLSTADQTRMVGLGYLQKGWQRCLLKTAGWLLRSRLLFWHLKRRGVAIVVWSYDRDEDFDEAFALGATGVMTDSPTKLRLWLERTGRNHDGTRAGYGTTGTSRTRGTRPRDSLVDVQPKASAPRL